MQPNEKSNNLVSSGHTVAKQRKHGADIYRMQTTHVPASAASAAILASLAPGAAFHGFNDLQVKDVVLKLSASYTDPTNWFFEVAVQPVKVRVRPTDEAVFAALQFIKAAQKTASFLCGVRIASDDPDAVEETEELRASVTNRLLASKTVVPVFVPRRDRNKNHKYEPGTPYKVQTPGHLVMQAVEFYSGMLSGDRRVVAPWNQAENLAPSDVNNYTMDDAEQLIKAFRGLMDTASAIEEVEGTVWPLEAVTPRPPTSENPNPSMTVWATCSGWSPSAKIWKLRITLQSGVMRVERCVPEVRFGSKDGPIFQNMENPVPIYVKGVRKMVSGWHTLAGLPPLSAGCTYLTAKFVPRQDILRMAPQLAAWLVNDKSAQKVACLQQMASVHAADRQVYAEASARYLASTPLTDSDKAIFGEYRGAALMLFVQKSVQEQIAAAKEVQQQLEAALPMPVAEEEHEAEGDGGADLMLPAPEAEADLVLPAPEAEAEAETEAEAEAETEAEVEAETEAEAVESSDA